MKKILILLMAFVLFGCASRKYYQTEKWKWNNTITIDADNLNQYSLMINEENVGIVKSARSSYLATKYKKRNKPEGISNLSQLNANSNQYNITFDGFKGKDIVIWIYHPDYETIKLIIDKGVRYDALAKDIALGLITYGIPLMIDPFKSDFYQIKKKSRYFKVHFEHNQQFMKNEFNKISSSKNVQDYNNWMAKYSKSEIYQKVLDQRDSLELQFALLEQKESAIDNFISSHQKSNFLDEAQSIKNELKAAREMFEAANKLNSVVAYEEFIQKYPNSLHNKDAHLKLVNAAERDMLNSSTSEKAIKFIENYLYPNQSFLTQDSIRIKTNRCRATLQNSLIKENISNDLKKQYENYSSLWKKYVSIYENQIVIGLIKSLDEISTYQSKICDLLFSSLIEANTKQKQSVWKENSLRDFPKLEAVYPNLVNPKNIIYTVLDNQKNGTGTVKLFDCNYFDHLTKIFHPNFGQDLHYTERFIKEYCAGFNNSNYQELSFSKGRFDGISKSFHDKELLFSMNWIKNGTNRVEISIYSGGKLLKQTFIPSDYNELFSPNQLLQGVKENLNDYSYDFENGVNTTLKNLDQKIAEGNAQLKRLEYSDAISTFENARKNKFPSKLSQNLTLDKNILEAKRQLAIYEKKQEELVSKYPCKSFRLRSTISMGDMLNYTGNSSFDDYVRKSKNKYTFYEFMTNGYMRMGSCDANGNIIEYDPPGDEMRYEIDMTKKLLLLKGGAEAFDWNGNSKGYEVDENYIISTSTDKTNKCLGIDKLKTSVNTIFIRMN